MDSFEMRGYNITPVDMCLGRGVCSLRMKNGNQKGKLWIQLCRLLNVPAILEQLLLIMVFLTAVLPALFHPAQKFYVEH